MRCRPALLLLLLLAAAPAGSQEAAPLPPPSGAAASTAAPAPEHAAADPAEVFVRANAAYEAGDARQAVELYESLLARGLGDGHLHYNLGNAYLRGGELGRAVAAYRRSQSLLPRNEDVHANLAFARKSTKDALAPPQPSAALRTLLFWHYGLSRSELAGALLVLNLLLWTALALRLLRRGSEVLRWLTIALLLLVLVTGASLAVHYFFPTRVAVVVPQEIAAHNGPDPESVVRFKLHAGTEVAVRDQRQDWLRVALPDGQQGWIRSEWAEVVEV